jgi:hypothetical protein
MKNDDHALDGKTPIPSLQPVPMIIGTGLSESSVGH